MNESTSTMPINVLLTFIEVSARSSFEDSNRDKTELCGFAELEGSLSEKSVEQYVLAPSRSCFEF